MNWPRPENSTISARRALIVGWDRPRRVPLKKMFSRPLSSKSNPVPSSMRGATEPRTIARPADGVMTPAATRSRVDFPAPLDPMSPRHSPCSMSRETLLSAANVSTVAVPRSFRTIHSLTKGIRVVGNWTVTPSNSIAFTSEPRSEKRDASRMEGAHCNGFSPCATARCDAGRYPDVTTPWRSCADNPVAVKPDDSLRHALGGYREYSVPADLRQIAEVAWCYSRAEGEGPIPGRGHRVLPEAGVSICFWSRRDGRGAVSDPQLTIIGPAPATHFFNPPPGMHLEAVRLKAEWSRDLLRFDPLEYLNETG